MNTIRDTGISRAGQRRRETRAFLFAQLPAALLLIAGCGGGFDPSYESGTGPAPDSTDGMNFATDQEAFSWVEQRAGELGLEVRPILDAEGKVAGVSGVSIGARKDVEATHARLLGELGGSSQTVRIAGRAFSLAPREESELGTTTEALCDGSLCTTHDSFRSNYLIYRSMGSNTSVTSGGYEFRRQTINGQGYMECIDYPGPLPVTCRGYCNYSQGCPAGLTQESAVGYPTCRKTCSGNVSNVTLSISAQAYEYQGSVLTPSFAGSDTTHDRSLEVKFWEVVTPGLDTAISRADGLCGTHTTLGPGGAVVVGNSHWASVPTNCSDAF